MRVTLKDASLARYAGQFVWLELNFDGAANQDFLARHGVTSTPSFYIIDPADGHAAATQLGAMTVPEVESFLGRGQNNVRAASKNPADVLLARGDDLLATDRHAEAASAYDDAIRTGGKTWPEHERAVTSLAWALLASHQSQRCAETAAAEAPRMKRTAMFGRLLVAGFLCANHDPAAAWAQSTTRTLEPLAAEAIRLPVTVRDHRFQLYQGLMDLADARGDKATGHRWGDRWLAELDSTKPANDDERSALDIARVDAASILDEPQRVLPALIQSERAMPDNYNASLRLAQMQSAAHQYPQSIAACDRGLQHVNGALGRSWLLQVKADALRRMGRRTEALHVYQNALQSARQIGSKGPRENNVVKIEKAIGDLQSNHKQGSGGL
jgi:tetratricopeptide (TPR) repeat protein